MNGNSVVDSSF